MVILPRELQDEFITYKRSIDLNSPILTQGALEIYLQSSMYKFHVQRTKKYYKEKMDVLRDAFEQQLDGILKCYIPTTGIYACLELNSVSADVLVKRLSKNNVLLSSTNSSYIDGFPHPDGLRLCFCKTDDEDIRKTIMLINQEVNYLRRKSK